MKKIYLILITVLLFNYSAEAQLKTKENDVMYYEEVVEINKSASEIHDAVEEFLALSSNNSNYTIKLNQSDKIISKGVLSVVGKTKLGVTLKVEFKDYKYKLLIDPISWSNKSLFTKSMHFDRNKAKKMQKEMYLKSGLSEKKYQKKDDSGEIDADIDQFIEMQKKIYTKASSKIISFTETLKEFVVNHKSSLKNDW